MRNKQDRANEWAITRRRRRRRRGGGGGGEGFFKVNTVN
jgi:hypothetical protein